MKMKQNCYMHNQAAAPPFVEITISQSNRNIIYSFINPLRWREMMELG